MNRRVFTKLSSLAGLNALAGTSPKLRALAGAQTNGHPSGSPSVSDLSFFDTYTLGTAYYPEWWHPSDWQTDFREMSELGFRAARMGEFAWAFFEPSPGKFDFNWMDHALEIANHFGVKGILATPTAAVPPWLYQEHPDVLGGNSQGPYTYGGRKGYCTNSPAYLEASARITTALAEHYGQHHGVIGWQLDNEPGYPFECYDPESEKAFQDWLQKRYGTLDELNGSMKKVIPPGVFMDLVGATAESVLDLLEYNSHNGSLDKKLESQLGSRFRGDATVFPPHTVMETLTLHGAEPVATFVGGRMEGGPAIVRRRHGLGHVFYVATDSTETKFYETLARLVGDAAGLKPLVVAPYGVEVASRQKDGTIFYFLLNLTEESFPDIRLPHPMDDLITGERDISQISLEPLETAVLASRS